MADGFTFEEVVARGYSAAELALSVTDDELRAAGFDAEDIIAAHDARKDHHEAQVAQACLCVCQGLTAAEARKQGYSARELWDAGYSWQEVQVAGFSPEEIREVEVGGYVHHDHEVLAEVGGWFDCTQGDQAETRPSTGFDQYTPVYAAGISASANKERPMYAVVLPA